MSNIMYLWNYRKWVMVKCLLLWYSSEKVKVLNQRQNIYRKTSRNLFFPLETFSSCGSSNDIWFCVSFIIMTLHAWLMYPTNRLLDHCSCSKPFIISKTFQEKTQLCDKARQSFQNKIILACPTWGFYIPCPAYLP